MTPDQAIAKIKLRMFNWNGGDIDVAAESELQLAQLRLERGPLYPWFLFTDKRDLAMNAGNETLALPNDFIAEFDEARPGALFYLGRDGKWKRLRKLDYDYMLARYDTSGTPQAYDILGNELYVLPRPNTSLTLRLLYYAEDATPQRGGSENLWLRYVPDLLIGEAGLILASQYISLPTAAQGFARMASEARQRLVVENSQRKEAAMNRIFGGDS